VKIEPDSVSNVIERKAFIVHLPKYVLLDVASMSRQFVRPLRAWIFVESQLIGRACLSLVPTVFMS